MDLILLAAVQRDGSRTTQNVTIAVVVIAVFVLLLGAVIWNVQRTQSSQNAAVMNSLKQAGGGNTLKKARGINNALYDHANGGSSGGRGSARRNGGKQSRQFFNLDGEGEVFAIPLESRRVGAGETPISLGSATDVLRNAMATYDRTAATAPSTAPAYAEVYESNLTQSSILPVDGYTVALRDAMGALAAADPSGRDRLASAC